VCGEKMMREGQSSERCKGRRRVVMGRSGEGGRVEMVMRSSDKEGERVQRLIGGCLFMSADGLRHTQEQK
jgi:hypothetical protein